MKTAIYPLSADPITLGHLNIIKRALSIFDKVIVAIGINESKKYLFTLEERTKMVEKATEIFDNVEVTSFEGMLTDFAYSQNINTIIRGARNAADFDYEKLLSDVNYYQGLGIETVVLFTEPDLSHISSSAAKAIVQNHGKGILDYVPLFVKEKLQVKINQQYMLGITGGIAVGKNFLAAELYYLVYKLKRWAIPTSTCISIIDTDKIGHYILTESDSPQAVLVREEIIKTFGTQCRKLNGMVDINQLSRIIFEKRYLLNKFNSIMSEIMHYEVRRRMSTMHGLIVFNSALIAEMDLSPLVNNNVVLVTADQKTQIERMEKRGYDDIKIGLRLHAQFSNEERMAAINSHIKKSRTGNLYVIKNNDDSPHDAIRNLAKEIVDVVIDGKSETQKY